MPELPDFELVRRGNVAYLNEGGIVRMKNFDKQAWDQIRTRGHARFIIRHGLLRWGVPFGLVVTLGQFLYDILTHAATPSLWSMVGSFIFLTLAFGYLSGEMEWRRCEGAYHENAV